LSQIEFPYDKLLYALSIERKGDFINSANIDCIDDRVCFKVAVDRDLLFDSGGMSLSVLQSRMSGWIPIARSSFTLCWVGFVFSSPAVLI